MAAPRTVWGILLSSGPKLTATRPCLCRHRARSQSTSSAQQQQNTPIPTPSIYVSDSHNPYFNLAFEDWVFRKTDPRQIVLYMYRNAPSVIIGRNQNPWKEVNLHKLAQLRIPVVRRKSGGGTVYHDLGNMNYCVFVPRTGFERRTNALMVSNALNSLDIDAYVNDRNDICVDTFKMRSAFKLVNSRAYHHGTMLINAKLSDLKGVLGTQKATLITKGVASVSSPVRNLIEWNSSLDHEKFVQAVSKQFAIDQGLKDELEVHSWEYKWGSTPEFTHEISGHLHFGSMTIRIHSRHAIITNAELVQAPKQIEWYRTAEEVIDMLIGDRYGTLEGINQKLKGLNGFKAQRIKVIADWLKREM
ncbi:hypothetical protein OIO90_005329 [Microbotryomycetes sp. JL221]|nr:hypothetical protein OIO90_005329 [Microbotryomycetes sp. JL221]